MKKRPIKKHHKEHGGVYFVGTMASDSNARKMEYYRAGCRAFKKTIPQATPLSLWTSADVWKYVKKHNVPYCSLYDDGYEGSGCFFCLLGIMNDRDRIERLNKSHTKYHKYCMDVLNYSEILKELGIEQQGCLF